MSEESAGEAGGKGWLSTLTQGDWLKIPGAVKAIGRLVGSTADAGAAWIRIAGAKAEQIEQSIRDETAARTAITKALARAGASKVPSDPELVERAISAWAGDRLRKQQNREAVAQRTIEHLKEGDPIDSQGEGPSDDWMNVFESHAERASSEMMRETWARVLAGEIRKPGAFSLATLQFISVLDQRTAQTVSRLFRWVMSGQFIFNEGKFTEGEILRDLTELDAYGLIRTGMTQYTISKTQSWFALKFGRKCILVKTDSDLKIPVTLLTTVGREVYSILSYDDDVEMIMSIADTLAEKPFSHIGVADCAPAAGGKLTISNLSMRKEPSITPAS